MAHESLGGDALADSLRDRREVQIEVRSHDMPPVFRAASAATSARIAQAIRMSAWCLGSERSRPDSHARQKICAGPMIWLKNNVDVIGSSSPRAVKGARPLSLPFVRRAFC